ncbi:hypothetical protein FOVG_18391 [Fusarium oxysporum f. sp. pisi HDV247]|uniref:Uncharacterized protein n=1 Tax=Fusarium oxysporum f. sp. pisi HDV247 TaxID=1080344 RepID=W9NBR4_FUSOX|nr:hypothetical protein FOVG_18391 [Fusarium oxysporum f. sp. pisi HDV247]
MPRDLCLLWMALTAPNVSQTMHQKSSPNGIVIHYRVE